MIRHVVMYQFKEKTPEITQKTIDTLLSMRGVVPQLRGIEVGADFLKSERSFDFCLITTFDSAEDMADYQVDEYHVNVVKKHMHSVMAKSISVDFEI